MKKMRTQLIPLLILGLCACARAADGVQRRLPGADLALPDIASNCQVAVVATLVSLGEGTPGAPFTRDYQSHWSDITSLWGQPPASGEFRFRTKLFLPEQPETNPAAGGKYILLSHPHDQTTIAKIILCTPEALREVITELKNRKDMASNKPMDGD